MSHEPLLYGYPKNCRMVGHGLFISRPDRSSRADFLTELTGVWEGYCATELESGKQGSVSMMSLWFNIGRVVM